MGWKKQLIIGLVLVISLLTINTASAANYSCNWSYNYFYGAAYGWWNMWDDCDFETAETRLVSLSFQDMGAGSYGEMYPPANYSNRTLYNVVYGRDFSPINDGYYMYVLPRNSAPPDPSVRMIAGTSHYWDAGRADRRNYTEINIRAYGGSITRRKVYNGTNLPGSPPTDETITPTYAIAVYWDVCDFTCDTWNSCGITDTKTCASATDGNGTGECPVPSMTYKIEDGNKIVYTGLINDVATEFTPETCDYCTPSWSCSNYVPAECGMEDEYQNCTAVTDGNNCYAQTGLASDQYSGDYSEFQLPCGGGGGGGGAPKEGGVPPSEPDEVDEPEPVPELVEVICNPGVDFQFSDEQKVLTSFRTIQVENTITEKVAETTCGYDADGDGSLCDLNEDVISCSQDCSVRVAEFLCFDPYRCVLTESWFLQIILLVELLVITYLAYQLFLS